MNTCEMCETGFTRNEGLKCETITATKTNTTMAVAYATLNVLIDQNLLNDPTLDVLPNPTSTTNTTVLTDPTLTTNTTVLPNTTSTTNTTVLPNTTLNSTNSISNLSNFTNSLNFTNNSTSYNSYNSNNTDLHILLFDKIISSP